MAATRVVKMFLLYSNNCKEIFLVALEAGCLRRMVALQSTHCRRFDCLSGERNFQGLFSCQINIRRS